MIGMGHKVDESLLVLVGPEAGPEELLENCWFFGNTKMSTTFSADPSSHKKTVEEAYESIQKLSVNAATKSGSIEVKGGGRRRRRKSIETSSKDSLPTSTIVEEEEEEDDEEEEMEFSMGKLIRQASLNHSQTDPPKKQSVITTSSIQQLGKKPEVENPKLEKASRPQSQMSQLKTQKSLSALQCNDLRLLAFESISPDATSPVLQEKLKREKNGVRKLTRTQSWAPPVPVKMGGKKSKEDIKNQIKFWARAVASNVNPES